MESLELKASQYTPQVSFNAESNVLELKGECYPENIAEFSDPLFSWLEEYLSLLGNQAVIVNVELNYFNSSTSKMLLNFFERLETEVTDNAKNISVNWIYDSENDSAEEYGEEFQEDLESLSFNLVTK